MTAPTQTLTCTVITLVGPDASALCSEALARETGSVPAIFDRTVRGGATVPGRRRAAVAQTAGALVALIEDTTRVGPDWVTAVRESLSDPAVAAVWGPVHIAPGLKARYRALGRMEYGRFHDGVPASQGPPGNCMVFRRAALEAVLPAGQNFAEHQVTTDLQAAGWSIVFASGAASVYAAPDPYGVRLATRFGHGRLYAATSHRPRAVATRVVGAAKALLLPLVLTVRVVGHARAAAPLRIWLAETPHVALMALAWSAGEFIGCIFGKGNSERTWR